jgi:hypothetical protein
VATRLQSNVQGAIATGTAEVSQRVDFGMRVTKSSMPAFRHYGVMTSNDTTNHRVGFDKPLALFGEGQGPGHTLNIELTGHNGRPFS